jgi:hypothetical protein
MGIIIPFGILIIVFLVMRLVGNKKEQQIEESQPFLDNSEKLLEERIALILKTNVDAGSILNDLLYEVIGKKDILITVEVYAYLNCLGDYFFVENKVEQNIRRKVFDYSWGMITNSSPFSGLSLQQEEINKFTDNRIENYAKILNSHKGLSPEYFESIIKYQLELISSIINDNTLSYYNPLPQDITDYSPINTSLFQVWTLNNVLHDFMIDRIIPYAKMMSNNFVNDYFTNKNYKPLKTDERTKADGSGKRSAG